ncbi:MAG TPA: DMT family transporter, partial [Vicinamibacterales bacterium]|nr:DMT family transporter [Vicinamibacterales bacterium]
MPRRHRSCVTTGPQRRCSPPTKDEATRPEGGHLSSSSRAFLALAVAGSLWGTGFLFGKLVLPDLSVSHLILYRLVFACAGFIVVLAGRWTTVGGDDWPLVLLAGVVGVPLVYLIQFEGLARTTVAHASLMVGAMPILLGLAAAVIARERLTLRHWILLLVSAAGALLIASGPNEPGDSGRGPSVIGDALVLLSLLAAVAWVLTSKRLMARY